MSFNLQSQKRKKYRILVIGENSLVDSFLLFLETTEKFVFIAQGGEMLFNRLRIDAKKSDESCRKPPTLAIREMRGKTFFSKAHDFQQRKSIDLRRVANEVRKEKSVRRERERVWSESNYPTISSRGDLCLPPLYAQEKLLSGAFVNRVEADSRQQQFAA